ncbi:hypothetical protein AB0G85_29765 [Streptomyces sioyaensis]|uniref:hypothetical protein n=1 Tax=Streptomyces sioyaensis TaxID=67364 RepID=UPI0033D0D669
MSPDSIHRAREATRAFTDNLTPAPGTGKPSVPNSPGSGALWSRYQPASTPPTNVQLT